MANKNISGNCIMSRGVLVKKEYCDKRRAKWVKDNMSKIPYRMTTDIDYDPEKRINDYCDSVLNTPKGYRDVSYKHGTGHQSGRLYAVGPSLQGLPREIRHTLAKGIYIDIDIVNCFPTLLLQLCKKYNSEYENLNISYHNLEEYVKNRDKIMKNIKDEHGYLREDVKTEILKLMFGGAISEKFMKIKFIVDFKNEMKDIQDIIADKNGLIMDWAKNKKMKVNGSLKGAVCSKVIQDIECKILLSFDKFLKKNFFDLSVLIHDGGMVISDKPITEELLKAAAKYCEDDTGYKVDFIIKPMNDGYDIPEKELEEIKFNETFIKTDKEAAKIVVDYLKESKDIVYDDERWFLKIQQCIYTEDTTNTKARVKLCLMNIIKNFDFCKEGRKETIHYSASINGLENIYKYVRNTALDFQDKDFVKKINTSTNNKICFLNGYWDFKERQFKPYDDSIATLVCIPRNFIPKEEVVNERPIVNDFLNTLFWDKESQKKNLIWLIRAIAGHCEDKQWGIGFGDRNSGKTSLAEILKLAFGEYVGNINANELTQSGRSSSDEAIRLKAFGIFELKRLIISSEIKRKNDHDQLVKLDGNLIKTLTSGGDNIKIRNCFEKEREIKPIARMLLMMNDMVQTDTPDAKDYLYKMNFNTKFVDEITEDYKKVNDDPEGEFKYFIKDPTKKEAILSNPKMIDAFMHILLESYDDKPVKIEEDPDDVDEDENEVIEEIKKFFVIGEGGYETTKDINDVIKQKLPQINQKKIKLKFRQLGVKTNVSIRDKLGKQVKGYKNIRIIPS